MGDEAEEDEVLLPGVPELVLLVRGDVDDVSGLDRVLLPVAEDHPSAGLDVGLVLPGVDVLGGVSSRRHGELPHGEVGGPHPLGDEPADLDVLSRGSDLGLLDLGVVV